MESTNGKNSGAIVNEHYTGDMQTMSYNGFTSGNTKIYLPNITRKYWGWTTPFAIQNIGLNKTSVTVKFYKKGIASAKYTLKVSSLPAGASVGINPASLPLGTFQGSVVASSSGQPIVAVCNEHSLTDSMAYSGIEDGTTKNYLPNITRKYFGWTTPFVVQNLDTTAAKITIRFYNSSGKVIKTLSGISLPINSSKGINPANYPELGSSFQGSVVVESNGKKISTVVNEQASNGQAMSYNGF